MNARLPFAALLGALLLAGCAGGGTRAGDGGPDTSATPAPASGAGHSAAGVVPGSHEDWCEEHQVPETQCTRCDPSLIPAFQAAGDWDAEHGLPMSQCAIHQPGLKIVRPPKPEGR